ncbi:MAG: hypothetical protein ABJB76_09370, partial [Candidatus Nitrosocosmicus sp.]
FRFVIIYNFQDTTKKMTLILLLKTSSISLQEGSIHVFTQLLTEPPMSRRFVKIQIKSEYISIIYL